MAKQTKWFVLVLLALLTPVTSASVWNGTYEQIDGFDDASVNTSLWHVRDAPVTETGGYMLVGGSASNNDVSIVRQNSSSGLNTDYKTVSGNVLIEFQLAMQSGGGSVPLQEIRIGEAEDSVIAQALVSITNATGVGSYTSIEIDKANEQARACTDAACDAWTDISSLDEWYVDLYHQNGGSVTGNWGLRAYWINQTINGLINLESPSDLLSTINSSLDFVTNATAPNNNTVVNATLYLYNSTGLFNTTTSTVTGNTNRTTFTVRSLPVDSYTWNVLWCDSSNACSFSSTNNTFSRGLYEVVSLTYNTTTYQTSTNNIVMNVSVLAGSTVSAGVLVWNGTSYTSTVTNNGLSAVLTNTFQTPAALNGTVSFYHNITVDAQTFSTTTNNQSVETIIFTICNTTLNVPYVNITFRNETVLAQNVSAYLTEGSFEYYLGDGTITKTGSFTNSSANPSYAYCAYPSHLTYYVDYDMTYGNSYSGSRSFDPQAITTTNSTVLQTLYLLPSSSATSISFVIKNVADQSISGATVNVTRAGYGLIAVSTTDDSGTVNFELDQSATYVVSASKTGYPTGTLTVTPAETLYTIILGESISAPTDYRTGVTWTINPTTNTYLNNNTAYAFNMTLTSNYWDVTEYGFVLTNGSGTVLDSDSTTTEGALVSTSTNTGNNTVLIMNYYWVINNTYTNGTIHYAVLLTGDTQYSILNFVTRLKTYLASGLFGLETQDGFGTKLLVFTILFFIMAGLSYQFGLTSPEGLGAVLVFLVLLFDVGFGLLSFSVGGSAFTHFASVVVVLLYLVLMIGRSVSR